MRRRPLLALSALLAGCAVVPPASPGAAAPPVAAATAAPPGPAPSPAPAVVALPEPYRGDWRDWPLTLGTWVYRRDARGSIALFGRSGTDAEVTLRCDRAARTLYLSRRGAAPGNAPLQLRSSTLMRSFATQPTGGSPAYMAVAIDPRDAALDAMGFSRGRFVLEQATLPTLVIPAWAEILRVTEDCRG